MPPPPPMPGSLSSSCMSLTFHFASSNNKKKKKKRKGTDSSGVFFILLLQMPLRRRRRMRRRMRRRRRSVCLIHLLLEDINHLSYYIELEAVNNSTAVVYERIRVSVQGRQRRGGGEGEDNKLLDSHDGTTTAAEGERRKPLPTNQQQ